jgi:hypothetical protein
MGLAGQMRKQAMTTRGLQNYARAVGGVALLTFAAHALAQQSPPASTTKPTVATAASQLPPGPALNAINEKCSACHSVATVFGQRRTPDDWAATVQLMVDRGADLSPDETSMVVGYLSSHYSTK